MAKITMSDLRAIEKVSSVAMAELLRRAFDLVAPKANWKQPIRGLLRLDAVEYDLPVILEAVTFMTGSVAHAEHVNDREVVVRAAGYYAAIGA